MPVPESTHEIASRVIEDAGGFDSNETSTEPTHGEDTGAESAAVTADTGAAAGTSEQPRSGDSDELLTELGLKPREDGREHRIPQKRVAEMRAKWEAKATEKAATEWQAKVADASRQAAEIEQGLHRAVMEQPEQFLRELATVNPQIAQFLAFEQRKQEAAQQLHAEMPQPDVPLPDGGRTYSLKGLQALLEWNTAQVETRLAERYKPVEQTVEQFRESQRRAAAMQQSETRVQALYSDAQTWPGWKENEAEIYKAYSTDYKDLPNAEALNAAYRKVVVSKLIAGKNATRQEVIADLQGRPKSTALSGSGGGAPAAESGRARETTSIARDVLRRLSAAQK